MFSYTKILFCPQIFLSISLTSFWEGTSVFLADEGKLKILTPKVKQAVSQIIFIPKNILLHAYIHISNYYYILSKNQDKSKLNRKHVKNFVLGGNKKMKNGFQLL